jgi:hypothetical protein
MYILLMERELTPSHGVVDFERGSFIKDSGQFAMKVNPLKKHPKNARNGRIKVE